MLALPGTLGTGLGSLLPTPPATRCLSSKADLPCALHLVTTLPMPTAHRGLSFTLRGEGHCLLLAAQVL